MYVRCFNSGFMVSAAMAVTSLNVDPADTARSACGPAIHRASGPRCADPADRGDGRAYHRQRIARGSVHHHYRALLSADFAHSMFENLLCASWQSNIERQVDAAIARQHARDVGIARLMPIARQTAQFRELVALQFCDWNHAPPAMRCCMEIFARAQIAHHVLRRAAERIIAGIETRATLVERNPKRLVFGAMLFEFGPTAVATGMRRRKSSRAGSRARSNSGADCAAGV